MWLLSLPAGNDFASRRSELSRFDELKNWLEKDKHAIARQRIVPVPKDQQAAWLESFRAKVAQNSQQTITIPDYWLGQSNDLSAKICRQMGKDVSSESAPDYQWFRSNCLTCHGGYEISPSDLASNQAANKAAGQVAFAAKEEVDPPGISCNYCHQESKGTRAWIDLHSGLTSPQKWRGLSPAEKSAQGMRDLTPARQQAQLCLECHVGNIEKGMFVTHDMYAAGHPPLPAVELRTLIEEMPRHWQSPKDLLAEGFHKTPSGQAYFTANYGVTVEGEAPRTATWDVQTIAVGALVAEQKWIDMLVSPKHWGDYALYDCAACHHELRYDSVRQQRRSPGAPGRPRLIEWPHPGALAVTAALGDDQFQPAWLQLQAAVKKRPFGDRQAVVASGQALNKQITQSLDRLALNRLPADYGSRLLAALCETPDESLLDYQTARWINWSARGLLQSQGSQDPKIADTAKSISMLGQAIGPDGKKQWTVTPSLPATQSQIIYPDFVERELAIQQQYAPDSFTKQLRDIGKALK